MAEDAGAASAPALVGNIAPRATDEPLTPVEANYLRLAKADADRVLQSALAEIIKGRGHDEGDGRRYNFVTDDANAGKLILRISA